MTRMKLVLLCVPAVLAVGCATFPDQATTQELAEKMVAEAFPGMPERLTKRAVLDPSQKICSKVGDTKLTQAEATEITKLARESIKYPASGKLVGDWKVGQKLAYNGAGTRIRDGKVENVKENGALCSNCHVLDPKEVNAGTLGPSLTGFGAQRGSSEAAVKYAYEKIYNSWAYLPCSNMPRLGSSGHLTPEQISHVVAYLIDPQSPVNKK
jgi:sulfur-oxidizing protein SoxX